MASTKVVNIRTDRYDVYIGRPSVFGNPFCIGPRLGVEMSREQAVKEYRRYFLKRMRTDAKFAGRVRKLKGKVLGCYCKPLMCHGDVICAYLNEVGSSRHGVGAR